MPRDQVVDDKGQAVVHPAGATATRSAQTRPDGLIVVTNAAIPKGIAAMGYPADVRQAPTSRRHANAEYIFDTRTLSPHDNQGLADWFDEAAQESANRGLRAIDGFDGPLRESDLTARDEALLLPFGGRSIGERVHELPSGLHVIVTGPVPDRGSRGVAVARRLRRPSNPKVSVVVPAMNEARNLEIMLPKFPDVYEVILVDGHSTDDTVATARRVMPDIQVIEQTRRGKGNALACGFQAVTGDIVIMFDADGSADPAEFEDYVAQLRAGADFAKGSRFVDGGGSDDITAIRKAGNAALNGAANILFGTSYTDLCYGYNAFWADVIPLLDLPATEEIADEMRWGDGFEIETLINTRIAVEELRIAEVPSYEKLRIHGESNLSATKDGLRVLKTLMTERRRAARQRKRERAEAGLPLLPPQTRRG